VTALRRNAVPLAIAAVFAVLVIVFHARLLSWFRGEHAGGASTASSTTAGADGNVAPMPRAANRSGTATGSGGAMGSGSGAGGAEIAYYTCSMHPSVRAHEPGTCPVCSMNLTPVTKADEQSGVVQLDEARQRAIGCNVVLGQSQHDTRKGA